MKKTITVVCVLVAIGLGGAALAFADSGSAEAPADPAASLHDPLSAPAAAFDDLKAAQKIGWPLAVLAALVIAARLLSRLGGVWSKLGGGKAALVIGAAGAASCAAYNAAAQGGSWMAVGMALLFAAAAYWDAHAKPKQADGGAVN